MSLLANQRVQLRVGCDSPFLPGEYLYSQSDLMAELCTPSDAADWQAPGLSTIMSL